MGAWGTGSFDNDGALDFLADYREGTVAVVETVLKDVAHLADETYIEADAGQAVIVAAEIVAASHDNPSTTADEGTLEDMGAHRVAVAAHLDLIDFAAAAVPKVMVSETSELAELWDDAEPADLEAFQTGVADLISRLEDIA